MIVIIIPPFDLRKTFNADKELIIPSYLWMVLKLCDNLPSGQFIVVADKGYFEEYSPYFAQGEIADWWERVHDFKIPKWEEYTRMMRKVHFFPRGSGLRETINKYIFEVDAEIQDYYKKVLHEIKYSYGEISYVITPCSCPSLLEASNKFGVKTIFFERGPLHSPIYKETGYFDFSGLIAQSDIIIRYNRFKGEYNRKNFDLLTSEELRMLLLNSEHYKKYSIKESHKIGIAFQDELDINSRYYNNSLSSIDIVTEALEQFQNHEILFRKHPNGIVTYTQCENDNSESNLEFILRCEEIWTINSSVAYEALLNEKRIRIFGKSQLNTFLEYVDFEERNIAMNFLFMNYIISWKYIFDQYYFKWRIAEPTEKQIYRLHLDNINKQIRK